MRYHGIDVVVYEEDGDAEGSPIDIRAQGLALERALPLHPHPTSHPSCSLSVQPLKAPILPPRSFDAYSWLMFLGFAVAD